MTSSPKDPAAGADGEPSWPIPLGAVLEGKYLIRRELGRGSMGIVFLGSDLSLERDIALKVLLPKYAKEQRVAKRFKLEAVAMAAVRSDNVVQIFSYGEYNEHPYFAMEYVPGFTVANLLEKTVAREELLYLDVVLGILRQVCQGLEAVHARGIVHRDVKPANMLVGPKFKVAITDFGLVETIHSSTERDLAGTPLYLAPELIRRQKVPEDLRFRTDIYALGISTYEMLTGDVPFDGSSIKTILRRHLHEDPPSMADYRTDVPTAVEEVIFRALAKDPRERHGSCMEFIEDLEEARHSATNPGATLRTGRPRVLIVDDDPESRAIFRTALKVTYPQASITTAPDGFQGLEMAKAATPDLMFVDLNMPAMNGIELVGALKGDEALQQIPIVVASAALGTGERTLLTEMGVGEFLKKPVDLTLLLDVTRRMLKQR